MDVAEYGWTAELDSEFLPYRERGFVPGRVVKQFRDHLTVVTTQDEFDAEVSGRFRRDARPSGFPAVGDWVALRCPPAGRAVIEAVLPRRSAFLRRTAGESVEAQVVAANVDTVFLVSGVDGDFDVSRIERAM